MSKPLAIIPLKPGLNFGATVTGLAMAHLRETEIRQQLVDLWNDKGVILFRGENSPAT